MRTNLEGIRKVLQPYLDEKTGEAELPVDLLGLLETADDEAKYRAEQMEGLLALYAGNKISKNVLRTGLKDLILPNRIQIGDALVLGDVAYPIPTEGAVSFGQMKIIREEEYV